jgi:hypothetical protein
MGPVGVAFAVGALKCCFGGLNDPVTYHTQMLCAPSGCCGSFDVGVVDEFVGIQVSVATGADAFNF